MPKSITSDCYRMKNACGTPFRLQYMLSLIHICRPRHDVINAKGTYSINRYGRTHTCYRGLHNKGCLGDDRHVPVSYTHLDVYKRQLDSRKNIRVRDRATLFNLIIGLNGYTVCSGVISAELNGCLLYTSRCV